MAITFGEAKQILSQYAGRGGKCPSNEEVALFVKQVLQYLLFSGHYGNIRKFCFCALKGCITIPYELEVPLKIKVDNYTGTAWDKWFEFYNIGEMEDCVPASEAIYEEPNLVSTVYELPAAGARVGAMGTAYEAADAHVIVQGNDLSGREVFTAHKGCQISGEYLSIKKNEIRYTNVIFGKITSVTKTRTCGYVQLLWVNKEAGTKGFLADYTPYEEKPQYRRFRITSPNCSSTAKVSILGRIRLKENYADNDFIPFDNLYALSLAGQAINAQYNGDVQSAQAKDQMMQEVIARESEYKRVQNGQPIDVFYPLSTGRIVNIV